MFFENIKKIEFYKTDEDGEFRMNSDDEDEDESKSKQPKRFTTILIHTKMPLEDFYEVMGNKTKKVLSPFAMRDMHQASN